ncbi:unnamed protein product (macronuclear) [Paramecium tetraurelia]|uniref:Uncharacterized protein n=1 Tax=Paramecium tetraurelia TaxID=5888 RepID=A0C520_PARTE|nr:uncharacterized protein GSPATT00006386001 [Paramecium tetraurelia]CAK65887.1 unnamed protein product [Paramecium tetraurelia]|eukprot:XP_001433284.1 hypothetical protein (macronuclear) [Paramecium tetraurelia strain d4-2]
MLQHLSLQQLELLYTKRKRQQKYQSAELELSAKELQDFNSKKPEDTSLQFDNEDEDQLNTHQDSINLLNEEIVDHIYQNPSKKRLMILGMGLIQCVYILITHFMGVFLFDSEIFSFIFCTTLVIYFIKIAISWIQSPDRGKLITKQQVCAFVLGMQSGMITAIILNINQENKLFNILVAFIPCTIMNIMFIYFSQKYQTIL